jgi:hypothetical protein
LLGNSKNWREKVKRKQRKRLTKYEMITAPLAFIMGDGTLKMAMAIIHLNYGRFDITNDWKLYYEDPKTGDLVFEY